MMGEKKIKRVFGNVRMAVAADLVVVKGGREAVRAVAEFEEITDCHATRLYAMCQPDDFTANDLTASWNITAGEIDARDSDGHLRSCLASIGRVGMLRRRQNGRGLARRRETAKGFGTMVSRQQKIELESLWRRVLRICSTVIKTSDRIMPITIVVDGETVNVISAYAPQVGLGEVEKKSFWDSLDELVRECPTDQCLIIGGDLNRHIGAASDGYVGVHEGFDYKVRNDEGRVILEFATAHDLVVVNSFFKKNEAHLITFQSAGHNTQIDYLLMCRRDLRAYAVKDTFGMDHGSARTLLTRRESWWLSDEVQTKVAVKQTRFRELLLCQEGHQADRETAEERYKVVKRDMKKVVAKANDKAYEDLYKKLDSKEGANDIYRIAKARDRRRRDVKKHKIYQDEERRSIVNEEDI
ncbi:retrovirus-related pol polyprotein LINE-1 [Tanacetum coccineum]